VSAFSDRITTHEVRPLELQAGGLTLRGTAYVPTRRPRSPTALLCHGFTGNRIETSRLFVTLARRLADVGIAAVAMDRAGHGESDGDFFDTTVSADIADALSTLDDVASFEFVDPDSLHLLGFSLGAVIASVVAAETSHDVRSLTLWSPAAVFADDAKSGRLPGQPTPALMTDGAFEFCGLRLGPEFLTEGRSFEPYERARGYQGPVRVLHGDKDFIPVEYVEKYRDIYGDAMELTIVDDTDHTWGTVRARDHLIGESVDFIEAHSGDHSLSQ
jgi:uncharacterized protein